ncbi:N-alpha-acetyltransferase 40-like [Anopheles stephensi]|uniref:N-alpha-acetyltransferase 40-like n=1 Tax=Anopheles stephensi TaxID=30069 RepID=UPI001658752A|nr:N-alpha-acetyltransferase 40-like [Anopheles stephensi]
MVERLLPTEISEAKYTRFQKQYMALATRFANLDAAIPECRVFRYKRQSGNYAELKIMCKRMQDLQRSFMEWAYHSAERSLKRKYQQYGFRWRKYTSYADLFLKWARYLIAYDSATYYPVGYIFFRFVVARGHTAVTIHGLHVEEQYRNHGLGTHLIKTLEILAHRLGVEILIVGVARRDTALKRFLRRQGFVADKSEMSVNAEYETLVAPTMCYKIMAALRESAMSLK